MSTELEKRKAFAGMVGSFDVLYGKESSEVKAQLYWDGLKDIPIEDIRAGFEYCRHHIERYPSVAKWRQCCELAVREREKRDKEERFRRQLTVMSDETTGVEGTHEFRCTICEDRGWAYCEKGGRVLLTDEVIGRKEPYCVRRCQCWEQNPALHRRSQYAEIREERAWGD